MEKRKEMDGEEERDGWRRGKRWMEERDESWKSVLLRLSK